MLASHSSEYEPPYLLNCLLQIIMYKYHQIIFDVTYIIISKDLVRHLTDKTHSL